MPIKWMSTRRWESKFLIMPGPATIAACLPTVKLVLVKVIVWWVIQINLLNKIIVLTNLYCIQVGYGKNKGIVPIACDEIFKRIANSQNDNTKYEVQFSMLEIYNEKVQDLLIADPSTKP